MKTLALTAVFGFWIWLCVAIAYGALAHNPAASRYKWLIGWPLGLLLIVARRSFILIG